MNPFNQSVEWLADRLMRVLEPRIKRVVEQAVAEQSVKLNETIKTTATQLTAVAKVEVQKAIRNEVDLLIVRLQTIVKNLLPGGIRL